MNSSGCTAFRSPASFLTSRTRIPLSPLPPNMTRSLPIDLISSKFGMPAGSENHTDTPIDCCPWMVPPNLLSHAARTALPTATSFSTSVLSAVERICTTNPPCIVPHILATTLSAAAGPSRINTSDKDGSSNGMPKVSKRTIMLTLPPIDCRSSSPSVTVAMTRSGSGHHTSTHPVNTVNTDSIPHEVVLTDGRGGSC